VLRQNDAVRKSGSIPLPGALLGFLGFQHAPQADALEIEAQAKRRLADEYDAAQERGEVAKGRPKSIPEQNTFQPTVSDIGLTSKEIHEARELRDAEQSRATV
jgi:hypothetical protein